jgi:drug/metabolite transporter (DMT)-like permease
MLGNLAVREIAPETLAFWRTAIATACVLPFALHARRGLGSYFRRQKVKVLVLSLTGVVLPAWFMYLSVRSDDLIDLSVGYTFIPLMAVLFSAWLLAERLAPIQYLGLAAAFFGALVFAFRGALASVASFDPHVGFLWMMAVCLVRSLYLVLLRKWDMHPTPGEGLFVLLALGTVFLLPGFIGQEVASRDALDYSWPVWGSIAFIGVGMGALYLHLISYGTGRIGATRASLFVYTVPLFVAAESVLFLGSALQAYQAVGALLVVGGVFLVSWFRRLEPHPSEVHH